MGELGGMLAAAMLKVVGDQIGSAIGGQIKLQQDFTKDLEKMKMTLESVEAVLEDAERRSVTDKSMRLWLKRLKDTMYAISDMIDEFEADTQEFTQPSKRKFSLKKHLAVMIPGLPIGPKITMANKMKTMREDLEEITCQHRNFNLLAGTNANELQLTDIRDSSSIMEAQIVGRTEEREKILASLFESMTKDITVLPIFGIGGIGKTTLARMVYNSSQFKDYSQVWVYVSQTFDLKKIGNFIISQLSEKEKESQYTTMEIIHKSLRELLADKKILIVLDDLWEDDGYELERLMAMLKVGNGSKVVVVVTTRDENIAKKISSIQPHKLAPLPDDMCWSIIKQKSAFESRDDKEQLEQIGKDIAVKCGGVALAAESLGHMLQSMTSAEWESVRDNDVWSLSASQDASSTRVLASLMLSYSVMPSYLKLCFAYCAIFPKGHKIVKDDLIYQWISLGFIVPTKVSSSWQLGERYIRKLLGLSFLQASKPPSTAGVNLEDVTLFTMHDLVHDLARSVMVDEILIAGKHGNTQGSRCHYALLNDCSTPLESSKIRALRFLDCGEIRLHDAAFSSAKSSLRVLDLSKCSIHKLPDSIGQLKQLRYLNAPRVQDEMIPDSITGLSKLIYLNLRGSSSILALPDSIGEIEGLMYLDFSGCSAIKELTESLGCLKKLVHLNMSGCSGITELPESLGGLKKLVCLNLSGCSGITELPESLGGLKKLVHLDLSNCSRVIDVSVFSGSLTELKYLNLSGCQYIGELPRPFKDLKNLVHLDLSNCHWLNFVPEALVGLTKLQYLNLLDTTYKGSLTTRRLRWLPEVIGNLTALRYLNLSCCMITIFRSSREIDTLLCPISTLSNLEHLDLSGNYHISAIPKSFCKLRKLHTLDLSHCRCLQVIPESIGTIDSLKFLNLNGCPWISEVPQLSSSSLSLPHFMVHAGDGNSGSNLVLLQHTDPVELQITRLENVKSVEEARSIKLMEKQSLLGLKLEWTRDAERFVDDKILLEKLVPPSTLKVLVIRGYNGVRFPVWVMGQLPDLKVLVVRDMEEWDTSDSSGEEYVIEKLEICDCPKLRMKPLPPRAIRLKISNSDNVLSSWEECTTSHTGASSSFSPITTILQVENCEVPLHQWSLLHHLPGLTDLSIEDFGELTCSSEIIHRLFALESLTLRSSDQEEVPTWLGELTSLQKLDIQSYKGLKVLQENMRQLTKLQSLELWSCKSMTSLPHWIGKLTSLKKLGIHSCDGIGPLPESIQQLTNLQELTISWCHKLKLLIESAENKRKLTDINESVCALPTSLKKLRIHYCKGIGSLPEGIQQLTNLQELIIEGCYELKFLVDQEENKRKLTDINERVCALPTSLKKLRIHDCKGIKSLPEDIQQLTNLQELEISWCPELKQWCESEENEIKLAHIKERVYLSW